MTYAFKFVSSPVGLLKLVANDLALVAILWENDDPKRVRLGSLVEDVDHPILCLAEQQLGEYFAGARKSFDLPLDFAGTPFQKKVWSELLNIPFGQTRTYGQIANANRQASRLPSGWRGKRKESDLHCGAMPSRDRQRRFAHRLCWGPRGEGMPPWNRSSIDDVVVDVSAGHDGLAPRSPSSLSRARSGCFLGRCRRSGPQVLRGISAPGAPRFGTRQQLDRIRMYARLVGQGAREAGVGGRKGIGLTHTSEGDVFRRPFADARQCPQVRDRVFETATDAE